MHFLLLLLLLSPPLLCSNSTAQSNLKTRLTKRGFNFLSKSAHKVIDKEVPAIEIPDITIPIDAGYLKVENIRIRKFQAPLFDLSLSPAGIHWESQGGAVRVRTDLKVKYGILYKEGWIVATASDLRISLSATASTLDGRPQLAITGCSMDIRSFDLQIGGDFVMWLVNLFRDIISAKVQELINDQACSYARDLLLTQGNDFLHSLPIDVELGKGFFLHYRIDGDPIFTSDHADLSTTVTVTYSNETRCSHAVTMLDAVPSSDSMASLWVSDQIPNCLMETVYDNENVSWTATHVNVPAIESYVKTSCLLTCIGFFFPDLRRDHPDQHVSLTFSPAAAPVLQFLNESTSLTASINLDFHIYPREQNPESLLRLNLLSVGDVTPYLEDAKLKGKVDSIDVQATQVFSKIGNVSTTFLSGFDTIFKTVTSSLMSVVLAKGIPLPIFDNLSISDTSLITERPGQLLLSLNFTDIS